MCSTKRGRQTTHPFNRNEINQIKQDTILRTQKHNNIQNILIPMSFNHLKAGNYDAKLYTGMYL